MTSGTPRRTTPGNLWVPTVRATSTLYTLSTLYSLWTPWKATISRLLKIIGLSCKRAL